MNFRQYKMLKYIFVATFHLTIILKTTVRCTDIAVNCHTEDPKTSSPSDVQLACQFTTQQLNFKLQTLGGNVTNDPMGYTTVPDNISATIQLSLESVSFQRDGVRNCYIL